MKEILQTKAKPIFQEEKNFLEEKLNIILPNDCWIVGGGTKYVYLDIYSSIPYIKFKVYNDGKFELIKDNSGKLKDYEQFTIDRTIDYEQQRLNEMWEKDIGRTTKFVSEHRDIPYNISISGGKDSEVIYNLWKEMLTRLDFVPDYEFIFFNTSNEVADVYKYIKARKDIRIINPEIGWYQYIKQYDYILPSIFKRFCCTKYKEGQVKKEFDTHSPRVQVTGMRNKESDKRSKYVFYMDYDFDKNLYGNSNMPISWSKLCPIIDWSTTDIWLLMIYKNFYINQKYKNGFTRVGCCICPFSNLYEDQLTKKYYPHIWSKFTHIASEYYNRNYYGKLLGYSLQEFIDGVWKCPVNKDSEYLNKKPTLKNIHEFAEYKGLSDEVAAKFWDKHCKICGKKLAPIEMSMFYKLHGTKEGEPDDRELTCRNCFCKSSGLTKKQYYEMAIGFKESGCKLF